ncbi:unnamed protein product [Amoebophrya sp. A25]|nr:unnamed protein product [Amoebophrya sp. A25]|eukprot:GSA25T00000239001.1
MTRTISLKPTTTMVRVGIGPSASSTCGTIGPSALISSDHAASASSRSLSSAARRAAARVGEHQLRKMLNVQLYLGTSRSTATGVLLRGQHGGSSFSPRISLSSSSSVSLGQQTRSFALLKPKVKTLKQKKAAAALIKLLPHMPQELVTLTTSFLRKDKNLKNLLQLVYSPAEPAESEDDRAEYERERRIYLMELQNHREKLQKKRTQLEESILSAIRNLPAEHFDEAILSDNEPHPSGDRKSEILPRSLLFHQMYKGEIFRDMDFHEKKRLQTFQNLMRLRYPHTDTKRADPERFWIPESQFVSRQRESARNKNAKMTRTNSPVNIRS